MTYSVAIKETTPITTIKENKGGWSICTWHSDCTGLIDIKVHTEKRTAEVAAKAFAESSRLVYVAPESRFVSIFKHGEYYAPVYVPFQGDVVGAGYGYKDLKKTFEEALLIANREELPFNPNFFIQDHAYVILYPNLSKAGDEILR